MTPVSTRYAAAAAVLLAIAAVPVWFHAAVSPVSDDCENSAALFQAREIAGVRMRAMAGAPGGVEGVDGGRRDGDRSLFLRVVRSFQPSKFYAQPVQFAFDTLMYLQPAEMRSLEVGASVLPVHWRSREAEAVIRIEAYLYVHGRAPVRHPALSGIARAIPQLLGGTQPISMLIVSGAAPRDQGPELRREVSETLAGAWRAFGAACGS